MRHFFASAVFVLLLCGCASHEYRENQQLLISAVASKDAKKIEQITSKKNFLPGEESEYLNELENGNAQFVNGNYCGAVEWFDKAFETTKNQYTVDISDKIASALSLGQDTYYGTSYENSLTRFYRSLANYHVFSEGQCRPVGVMQKKEMSPSEKRQKLYSARSSILEWHSWMKSRNIAKDDRLYIDDLLMKLWGAFISEKIGGGYDLQTAKHLYEDAKDVVLNRMAVYKLFNTNSDNFVKNLDKPDVRQRFIDKNNEYVKDINEFADRQIERLKHDKKVNLQIILREDGVALKKVKKKDITGISLGTRVHLMSVATLVLRNRPIYVELPYVEVKAPKYKYYYRIKKNGSVVKRNKIVLAEPISEIAYNEFQEKIDSIHASIIAAAEAKYIACLTTAYNMIMSSRSRSSRSYGYVYGGRASSGVDMNTVLAVAGFEVCRQSIEDSGMYDIRQWVSLPSNIFVGSDSVGPGAYDLEIVSVNRSNGAEKVIENRRFNIKNDSDTEFIDLWV
ncbi:MAG: hypothetical protein IJ590_01605 [Rickettsiales bacterium]|nr:hypothetical protein [Rickettsiales bacterium]